MQPEFSVTISGIGKSYGDQQALAGITAGIFPAELFGFIGPDGAGKTTLFRILATLLLPDEGTATVMGFDTVKDYRKIRNILGYMPGRFSLYSDLSVQQNLEFYARIFGTDIDTHYYLIKDIYEHLAPFSGRLAGKLSGGMKQKLALCCALIHKPDVLILDEPTTGVDAVSRKEFWEMLKRLKKEGITIIVSTPYMDEASLCDRVALIQSGGILSIDKPGMIVQKYRRKLMAVRADDLYRLVGDLRDYAPGTDINLFGSKIHVSSDQEDYDQEALEAFLVQKGHSGVEISPVDPGIEDCFIELMKSDGNRNQR